MAVLLSRCSPCKANKAMCSDVDKIIKARKERWYSEVILVFQAPPSVLLPLGKIT